MACIENLVRNEDRDGRRHPFCGSNNTWHSVGRRYGGAHRCAERWQGEYSWCASAPTRERAKCASAQKGRQSAGICKVAPLSAMAGSGAQLLRPAAASAEAQNECCVTDESARGCL